MNASPRPLVSIVIPTHDRGHSIDLCLDTLAAQTYPAELTQTIVVADGCSDDTAAVVRLREQILLIEQPQSGPAAARNAGAAAATGDLLIFLDDDMQASPDLVAAHVRAHQKEGAPTVVLGYCPARPQAQKGLYRAALYDWWEQMFDALARPNWRFHYTDLLSGNVSMSRSLFQAAGGFNTDLWCHEDYELGLRLVEQGAAFLFEPDALSLHNEHSDLRKAFTRKFDEGVADVQIGALHPHVVPWLPLAKRTSLRKPDMPRLLAFSPWPVRQLWSAMLWGALLTADVAQLRRVWRRISDHRLSLYYWMGVRRQLKHSRALRRFVDEGAAVPPRARPELTIDVSGDLCELERLLDEVRPADLWIRYRDQHVGYVRSATGDEWLRGAHLRPLLGYDLAYELVMAMGAAAVRDGSRANTGAAPSTARRRVGSNIIDI